MEAVFSATRPSGVRFPQLAAIDEALSRRRLSLRSEAYPGMAVSRLHEPPADHDFGSRGSPV